MTQAQRARPTLVCTDEKREGQLRRESSKSCTPHTCYGERTKTGHCDNITLNCQRKKNKVFNIKGDFLINLQSGEGVALIPYGVYLRER